MRVHQYFWLFELKAYFRVSSLALLSQPHPVTSTSSQYMEVSPYRLQLPTSHPLLLSSLTLNLEPGSPKTECQSFQNGGARFYYLGRASVSWRLAGHRCPLPGPMCDTAPVDSGDCTSLNSSHPFLQHCSTLLVTLQKTSVAAILHERGLQEKRCGVCYCLWDSYFITVRRRE
jgi:hypothetical protein